MKGVSSHTIRQRLWDRVRGKLWGDSFWSDGYFYRSVGSTTSEAVRYYIERSQRKHFIQHDYETAAEERAQARLTDFA